MPQTLATLVEQFAEPGLSFEAGSGGLLKAAIHNATVKGELYLHGAHVTAWQAVGKEPVLWISRASNFQAGKPIRGGVPICFPWFGPHPTDSSAPAHGLARITEWQVTETKLTAESGIAMQLHTRIEPFLMTFHVEFGRRLKMTLTTQLPSIANSGQRFEDALHTYFAVRDVREISVTGLEATGYIDKADNGVFKPATGRPVEFTGETDRVYLNTKAPCVVTDRLQHRSIVIRKSGSKSTVVWNPWINKSRKMQDFGDDEWTGMVCVETANVGPNAIELIPGESHTTSAEISLGRN